jgi:hypothetical protein
VLYVPSSVIYHKFGGTGGDRRSSFRISLVVKNRLATLIKNAEPATVAAGLLVSAVFEAYRALFFLRDCDSQAIKAVVVGLIGFFGELPGVLARRRVVQRARKVSDAELYAVGALSTLREAYREYRRVGV